MKNRTRIAGDPSDPRHGTVNGYSNLSCRCVYCRDAWADYCFGRRAARVRRGVPDPAMHGIESTYTNYGCRCAACRKAHTHKERRRRSAS